MAASDSSARGGVAGELAGAPRTRFRPAGSPGGWLGGGRAAVAAVVLVLAIDVVALTSIVAARGEARSAAVEELAQRTRSQARAMEALLATLRADLAFLASSSSLAASFERLASEDPLSRRWARLDAEGTLLLFAEGHPSLVVLELTRADGSVVAAVTRPGRSAEAGGDPVAVPAAPPVTDDLLSLRVAFPAGGSLWAVSDPARLLSAVAPRDGVDGTLQVALARVPEPGEESDAVVRETIDTRGWQPDGPLVVERTAPDGPLLAAVERLAARWRTVVLLNLVVVSLGLPLAVLAVRAARSAARLAAEREHEQRRRELEERLWRQERLATVGRLAANIAHEINNPLAGLTNHVTLLEDDLRASDHRAAERRLPLIRDGMERVRDIVQRTLRLAKPSETRGERVELVSLTRDTAALICAGVSEEAVRLHAEEAHGDLVVEGERAMLGQLLTNLLVNALDFGAGEPVDVYLGRDSGDVIVVVEDQGPGIDEDLIDRLFEPFVSGRGSTGLGLAVCLGIAREHGGTIGAENLARGGARFTVRLPEASLVAGSRPAFAEREAS